MKRLSALLLSALLIFGPGGPQPEWQHGDSTWIPESGWLSFFRAIPGSCSDNDQIDPLDMDDICEHMNDLQSANGVNIALREETTMERRIDIEVNGQVRAAVLNDNRSADAFLELLAQGPVTVNMHDFANFEKVGPLGTSLPRSDEYITTTPGDVILYEGNQVTIYYAVNSWDFTLLGHIEGATGENMREFLGDGDPAVTFSLREDN